MTRWMVNQALRVERYHPRVGADGAQRRAVVQF